MNARAKGRSGATIVRMHNPPHPGEVLKDTVLREGGGLSVTELAKRLGVSCVALSRVVNGRAAVSAELAIRLAAALGGSAESWLRMQVSYDLWQAQRKRRPKIEPLKTHETDLAA
jgi:antitoxin HigA-1